MSSSSDFENSIDEDANLLRNLHGSVNLSRGVEPLRNRSLEQEEEESREREEEEEEEERIESPINLRNSGRRTVYRLIEFGISKAAAEKFGEIKMGIFAHLERMDIAEMLKEEANSTGLVMAAQKLISKELIANEVEDGTRPKRQNRETGDRIRLFRGGDRREGGERQAEGDGVVPQLLNDIYAHGMAVEDMQPNMAGTLYIKNMFGVFGSRGTMMSPRMPAAMTEAEKAPKGYIAMSNSKMNVVVHTRNTTDLINRGNQLLYLANVVDPLKFIYVMNGDWILSITEYRKKLYEIWGQEEIDRPPGMGGVDALKFVSPYLIAKDDTILESFLTGNFSPNGLGIESFEISENPVGKTDDEPSTDSHRGMIIALKGLQWSMEVFFSVFYKKCLQGLIDFFEETDKLENDSKALLVNQINIFIRLIFTACKQNFQVRLQNGVEMSVKGPERVAEAIRAGAVLLRNLLLDRTHMRNEKDVFKSRKALMVSRSTTSIVDKKEGKVGKKDAEGEKRGGGGGKKDDKEKGGGGLKSTYLCVFHMAHFLRVRVGGQEMKCPNGGECHYLHRFNLKDLTKQEAKTTVGRVKLLKGSVEILKAIEASKSFKE